MIAVLRALFISLAITAVGGLTIYGAVMLFRR